MNLTQADLQQIGSLIQDSEKRISEAVDSKIHASEKRLETTISSAIEPLRQDISGLKQSVESLTEDVGGLTQDIRGLVDDVLRVEGKVDALDQNVDDFRTYVEGEDEHHYMTKYEVEQIVEEATSPLQEQLEVLKGILKKANLIPA